MRLKKESLWFSTDMFKEQASSLSPRWFTVHHSPWKATEHMTACTVRRLECQPRIWKTQMDGLIDSIYIPPNPRKGLKSLHCHGKLDG